MYLPICIFNIVCFTYFYIAHVTPMYLPFSLFNKVCCTNIYVYISHVQETNLLHAALREHGITS